MDGEDPGLLGGLPRERRGTRSDKRSTGAKPVPRKRPAASRAPEEPADAGGPIRGAGRIAGAGLRVAGGVTRGVLRGVLRRLPRP